MTPFLRGADFSEGMSLWAAKRRIHSYQPRQRLLSWSRQNRADDLGMCPLQYYYVNVNLRPKT